MLRHGIAAALLLLVPASAGFPLEASQARAGRSDDPDRARSAAEFPAADGQIWGQQQNGQRAKDVARRVAARQADVETLQLLVDLQRHDDALKLLQTIVETRPELIAAAFNALGFRTRDMLADAARNYGDRLRGIVGDARRRAAALPREQSAEVARALVTIESEFARDHGAWRANLAGFVREYEGTETALLAQVDLLTDATGNQKMAALDAFVAANPGTNAAAKALYLKGFDLSHNPFSFGERKGHDPTDRFFRVVAIEKELGSGRYPASEWVDKAPRLIGEFSSFEPAYAAGNPERILAVYDEELPRLLAAYEADPARSDLAFVVGWRMGDLLKLKGDALAGVDTVFDRLERMAASPDSVKLLRAEFYLSPSGRSFEKMDRTMLRGKASAQLESLAKNSQGFHQRKAVATLAKLRFDDGKFDAARALFRRYLESYPDASYAWVAALRIAQCDQSLGNVKEAAGELRRAAERFRANPLAVVLGRAYAARAAEAAGDFREALGDYKAAQSAWDADYGSAYSLYATRRPIPGEPFLIADDDRVTRDAVTARIAELTRSLDLAGGALVERGRWLLARERWRDAEAPLLEFLAARAASPLAPEARELLHRARLEQALELADAESSATDVDAAVSALRSLAAGPPDFAVCAARMAVATIAALRGSREEADATMAGAMRAWQSLDAKPSAPRTDVERDVIEIRNAVFRPKGDGVYAGGQRWNAFNWESGGAPYVVLDPELRVKSSDGRVVTIEARDPFPDVSNVVFLDARRRVLLERVMLKLGGTKRRAWTSVMQTPNQPAGPSMDVLRFWQRSFPAQPGHWGGWVFLTYPIVGEIEFIDAARTKATARVTVGYSGATVQMEKRNGTWVARELTNFWIT